MNGEEPQPSISSNMNHAILGCRNGRFRSSKRGRRNSSRPGIVEMVLVLEHAWESDGKWLVTLVYPWFYESLKLGLPRITCTRILQNYNHQKNNNSIFTNQGYLIMIHIMYIKIYIYMAGIYGGSSHFGILIASHNSELRNSISGNDFSGTIHVASAHILMDLDG